MTSNNENRIKELEEQLAQALYVNHAVVKTAMAKEADDAVTIAALKARIAVLEARKPLVVEKIVVKTIEIQSTASLEAIACLNAALGLAASAMADKEAELKDARIAAAALAKGITELTVKFNTASSSLASADAKIATLKGRHAAETKAAAASQAKLVNELEAAKVALDSRPALALDKVDKVDSGVEIDESRNTPAFPATVSVPVVSGPVLPASKELDALRTAFLTATSKADKAICHDALASALIDGFCSTTTTTTTATTTMASTTTATASDNEATLKQELAEANRALGIAKGLIQTLKSRLPASV